MHSRATELARAHVLESEANFVQEIEWPTIVPNTAEERMTYQTYMARGGGGLGDDIIAPGQP